MIRVKCPRHFSSLNRSQFAAGWWELLSSAYLISSGNNSEVRLKTADKQSYCVLGDGDLPELRIRRRVRITGVRHRRRRAVTASLLRRGHSTATERVCSLCFGTFCYLSFILGLGRIGISPGREQKGYCWCFHAYRLSSVLDSVLFSVLKQRSVYNVRSQTDDASWSTVGNQTQKVMKKTTQKKMQRIKMQFNMTLQY